MHQIAEFVNFCVISFKTWFGIPLHILCIPTWAGTLYKQKALVFPQSPSAGKLLIAPIRGSLNRRFFFSLSKLIIFLESLLRGELLPCNFYESKANWGKHHLNIIHIQFTNFNWVWIMQVSWLTRLGRFFHYSSVEQSLCWLKLRTLKAVMEKFHVVSDPICF